MAFAQHIFKRTSRCERVYHQAAKIHIFIERLASSQVKNLTRHSYAEAPDQILDNLSLYAKDIEKKSDGSPYGDENTTKRHKKKQGGGEKTTNTEHATVVPLNAISNHNVRNPSTSNMSQATYRQPTNQKRKQNQTTHRGENGGHVHPHQPGFQARYRQATAQSYITTYTPPSRKNANVDRRRLGTDHGRNGYWAGVQILQLTSTFPCDIPLPANCCEQRRIHSYAKLELPTGARHGTIPTTTRILATTAIAINASSSESYHPSANVERHNATTNHTSFDAKPQNR